MLSCLSKNIRSQDRWSDRCVGSRIKHALIVIPLIVWILHSSIWTISMNIPHGFLHGFPVSHLVSWKQSMVTGYPTEDGLWKGDVKKHNLVETRRSEHNFLRCTPSTPPKGKHGTWGDDCWKSYCLGSMLHFVGWSKRFHDIITKAKHKMCFFQWEKVSRMPNKVQVSEVSSYGRVMIHLVDRHI